jgi:hypothetical protein
MELFSGITERDLWTFLFIIVSVNCVLGLIVFWLTLKPCIKFPKWPDLANTNDKDNETK